ncbi:3-isopropylmalate dehydratase small subunit [Roseovarius salinarum]|uniref:3-isopropylmalate dehydratase small subunit n=1 Tax=Roseovarius salinarum TaxID=1981892 RepID=UPI000C33A175|nr:3-isopropylmalate dehydratase small subunit [Roseovarius salinarum]
MTGWTHHRGKAVALPVEGIDTDQLIPARFMSRPRAAGYGDFLLHDLRFDADGTPDPDFPLNRPEAAGASILVTRRNFGGGSSREAAVYALADFGFRAVIAPSFGDIFAANAVNNGLLPARVGPEVADALLEALAGAPARMEIDLEACSVALAGRGESYAFTLDDAMREKLVNGWDDIDLTRRHAPALDAYRRELKAQRPWLWPGGATG